jgi:sugar phosphate isomerase/epimerase
MKLAFSTLGCPRWELPDIARAARGYGYEGVELRALGGSLDLLNRPEFSADNIDETRAWLAERGIAVCCVDTSCAFHERKERREQVEAALRHCELAARLGAPLIRVFPDKIQPGATREETRDLIVECLLEVAAGAPDGVRVCLETHGDFARAETTAEIVKLTAHPKVGIIWDVANSFAAGDLIGEAARVVSPYLAHVHLRDARPVEGEEHWRPVLAGTGEVSFSSALKALRANGYDGYVSFEWEKYWHPEIEEPEVALPDFAQAVRPLLSREFAVVGDDARSWD